MSVRKGVSLEGGRCLGICIVGFGRLGFGEFFFVLVGVFLVGCFGIRGSVGFTG